MLLAQSHDVVADGITFWGVLGALTRLDEVGALGGLAELVAEHSETPGRIAKALGAFM